MIRPKAGIRKHLNYAGRDTIASIIVPGRCDHRPVFDKILPNAMARLVRDGYFIKDKNAEGGYHITAAGLKYLKQLKNK